MRLHRDLIAGTLFVLIGWFALHYIRPYPLGSPMRMGPGYFPSVLGWLLVVLGAWIGLRGARARDAEPIGWGWRPLAWITAAMLAFGFLMPRFGLVPALAAMLPIAAAGGREFRWLEVLVLTALMCAFSVAVFVYGLKLPYRLFAY